LLGKENKAKIISNINTLTDPKQGITKSVQYALSKFNFIEENLDKLEPFIGPPLVHSFMEIYAFSEPEAKIAIDYYREYFQDKGIFENELYAGMSDLLEMLTDQQRVLMVATSKPTVFAERILKYFNIEMYFQFTCGSNLDGTRSDKTEIIKYILDEKCLTINNTLMIGDRKHDIIGAHNNGIASTGLGYGYGSEQELIDIKPTFYVKTVQELTQIFQGGTFYYAGI
jgi:phosphoglycolate phosphatase